MCSRSKKAGSARARSAKVHVTTSLSQAARLHGFTVTRDDIAMAVLCVDPHETFLFRDHLALLMMVSGFSPTLVFLTLRQQRRTQMHTCV
jgi:hypothetical protein